jgi:hypothetical protein
MELCEYKGTRPFAVHTPTQMNQCDGITENRQLLPSVNGLTEACGKLKMQT